MAWSTVGDIYREGISLFMLPEEWAHLLRTHIAHASWRHKITWESPKWISIGTDGNKAVILEDLRRWRTAYLWSRARVAARVRWVLTRWHEDCCAARYNLTKDDLEEEVADFNAAVAAVLAPRV